MTSVLPADLVPGIDAEARKVVAVRPNRLLLAAPVALALIATLITALMAGPFDPMGQPATGAATIGLYLGMGAVFVVAALLGIATTGGEYRRKTMALTVLFAPDRDRLVTAKYAATAAIALAVALVAELVSVLMLLAAGRGKFEFGLRLSEVLAAGLLVAACWAVLGAGIGLLLRTFSGAVWLLLGWAFALEPLIWLVAKGFGAGGLVTVLPVSATVAGVSAGSFQEAEVFAPTPAALVVLVLWAGAVGVAGWWDLRNRDL
ncbi:ABC transporter permease [Nocardia mangyaensis]|uniref:ABC transporter permease n=1 Tax=Nocardia mangyaensis TaxID=2213200 RepID=UPI00267441EE|nr:ABC transporter permease [Nocardia mangyaensis]MDO3645397.1 ABC transporter permease [Nocardia mangyaensis]